VASSKGSKSQPEPSQPSKWVVVQLTPMGEREKNISLIEKSIHQILKRKDLSVFVPAVSQKGQKDSLTTWYADGYIFIQFVPGVSYSLLQDKAYFSIVLSKPNVENGVRKLAYSLLEDKDLDPMRDGMKVMTVGGFRVDQRVRITKGNFKNLKGKISVIYDGAETVQVYVDLLSKKMFLDFPASYLEKLEDP
jgi:transcription antitermination factor NusG